MLFLCHSSDPELFRLSPDVPLREKGRWIPLPIVISGSFFHYTVQRDRKASASS
ncbi:hypothetical protein LptCag_1886 [Leptospirillum ferriphilum]|uniref:Uncharacterized protein n=1 Tax=Leptospirillum ferriphilum TaxID=178606 RepID=A0A094YJ11_9BACT|nr:hypothetical protein LptCag_1886 [Leptospirillum ferriphilum]